MHILKTLRKIRNCEDEATAQQLLNLLLSNRLKAERNKIWEQINKHIKPGNLGGDGCDKNAERNGLVMATNIVLGRGI